MRASAQSSSSVASKRASSAASAASRSKSPPVMGREYTRRTRSRNSEGYMEMTGSCLCGEVAFEVEGPVEPLGHCHCGMCRKTHGAAFVSYGSVPKARFRWLRGTENVKRYASSEYAWRPFCTKCG